MPVLNKGDSNMAIMPMAFSPSTVRRRFEVVDEFTLGSGTFLTIYDSKTPFAAVIDASPSDIDGDVRHRVVATLELCRPERFDGILSVKEFWQDSDALQVEGVVVQGSMQGFGLATRMYETLVLQKGITLMSDNTHYEGGKALWQHIAAKSKKLQVFVLDSDEGIFYPYDGTKLRYDGACIREEDIWSVHPDTTHYGVILIAEDAEKIAALTAA